MGLVRGMEAEDPTWLPTKALHKTRHTRCRKVRRQPPRAARARIVKWAPDTVLRGKLLGEGGSGRTYKCAHKATQQVVAVKSVSREWIHETDIIKHLPKHPNIVRYKGSFQDGDLMHIVMELCEGGDLFDHIFNGTGAYAERRAAGLLRSIVEVVQACHQYGIMHRDLKPENLLFLSKSENSPLKVIDFGLSLFFRPGERFADIAGTSEYMAPEMLQQSYGPEVDLWSAGVILYNMLSARYPFRGETRQGIEEEILRGAVDLESEPWPKVSSSAKSLVRHMLDPDPEARYSAQQVLNHPWMQINAYGYNIHECITLD